jgi:hypothetical protein
MRRILVAVSLVVLAELATAGPYTAATRATQVCNEQGRELGLEAFSLQANYREANAKISEASELMDQAKTSGDTKAFEVQKFMLDVHTGALKIEKTYLLKSKTRLTKKWAGVYGNAWGKVANKTWDQVFKIKSESQASDLGFAVCMDGFLGA